MTNYGLPMESMLISEFKAKAIATLKRVRDTGQPVLVTIRGVAVAEIFPPRTAREESVVLGVCSRLVVERPPDAQLVSMSAADEWEMNQ
jgi:prevent-host-death family protein